MDIIKRRTSAEIGASLKMLAERQELAWLMPERRDAEISHPQSQINSLINCSKAISG
jgi:hypothetical protein